MTNVSLCEVERAESEHRGHPATASTPKRMCIDCCFKDSWVGKSTPLKYLATMAKQKYSFNAGPKSTAGKRSLQTVAPPPPTRRVNGETVTFMRW